MNVVAIVPMSKRRAALAAILATALVVLDTRADAPIHLVEHEKPIIGISHELIADSATVSPDGQRLAIVSAEGQRQRVVVDGRYGRWYAGIARGSIVFSPDSRRLAYVATQGGKSRVVVDGVDGKPYDTIGGPGEFTSAPMGVAGSIPPPATASGMWSSTAGKARLTTPSAGTR